MHKDLCSHKVPREKFFEGSLVHKIDRSDGGKDVENLFLKEDATKVRALFAADTETPNIFGRVPRTKDILITLRNTQRYHRGEIKPARSRLSLGQVMIDAKGTVIAYMSITIAQNAKPTACEHQFVWGGTCCIPINGVFVKNIIVHPHLRDNGYGTLLISEVRRQADNLGLHAYCDIKADNSIMRSFLHKEGWVPSIFWHTQSGTLMVRYMLL